METRIDIISDTHGHISPKLRRELIGADYIIHAGDITSLSDFRELQSIAKVRAVLGNNDFDGMYGPFVERYAHFVIDGVTFDVAHYEQDVHPEAADMVVFGHTHRPVLDWREMTRQRSGDKEREGQMSNGKKNDERKAADHSKNGRKVLFLNPGSPTFPRGGAQPSLARIWIRNGGIQEPEIIEIVDEYSGLRAF